MLLPIALLGLLGLFAATSKSSKPKSVVRFEHVKRFLDKSLEKQLRDVQRLPRRHLVDPPESRASNPAKFWQDVVLPPELVPAWQRLIRRSVGLMAQVNWDKNSPGERPTADVDQHGTGKNLLWVYGYSAERSMRDAIIFGVITRGVWPEGTEEVERVLGDDDVDKGAVTAEHIAAATGTTAAAIGSLAVGTVATTVATSITSSLVAVGVPSAVATTIGTTAGSAAGLAAAAGGVASIAAAVWPAAAMAAALASIVSIFWGAIGSAKGWTLRAYLVDGRPATPDVAEATALRDAGGRISDALRLIEPIEMIVEDAYERVYPGESPPEILPKISGSLIDEQAALEQWIANFLLNYWGMPWTKPFAELYQLSEKARKLGVAPPPVITDEKGNAHHGFEWIGKCTENGVELPPASTEGRRRVLAIFAGLGEKEAEWLAKKPGTRGAFPS